MSEPLLFRHAAAPVRCICELDDGRVCAGDQQGSLVVLHAGSSTVDGTMSGHQGERPPLSTEACTGGLTRVGGRPGAVLCLDGADTGAMAAPKAGE